MSALDEYRRLRAEGNTLGAAIYERTHRHAIETESRAECEREAADRRVAEAVDDGPMQAKARGMADRNPTLGAIFAYLHAGELDAEARATK